MQSRPFPDPSHFAQGNFLLIRGALASYISVKNHGVSKQCFGWVLKQPGPSDLYLWSPDLVLLSGDESDEDYPEMLAEVHRLNDYKNSVAAAPPQDPTPSETAPTSIATPSLPNPMPVRSLLSNAKLKRYTLDTIPHVNSGDFAIVVQILHVSLFLNGQKHVKHVLVWDGTGTAGEETPQIAEVISKIDGVPLTGAVKQVSVWQTAFNRFPESITSAGCWVRLSGIYAKFYDGAMDIASRDSNFCCEAVENDDPIVAQLLADAANNPIQRMPKSSLHETESYTNPQISITVPSLHTVTPSLQHQNQHQPQAQIDQYANANKRAGAVQYAEEPPVAKRPMPLESGRILPSQTRTASAAPDTLDYIPVDPLLSTTTTKIKISATKHASPITYASRVKGKLSGDCNVSELYRVRGYLQYIWPRPSKSQPSDFIRKTCTTCHMVQQEGQVPCHLSTCQGLQYADIFYFVLKVGDDHDSINIQVTGSAAEYLMRCTAKNAKAKLSSFDKLMKSLEREIGAISDFFVVASSPSRPGDPPSFLLFGTEFNALS